MVLDAIRDGDPLVQIEGLGKTYDGLNFVVDNLDLTIRKGEFLTFLGPSGSGKTTTLMMLAGFEAPSRGSITYEGRSIASLPPHKRNIGMVFQNYALFPHLTVAENVGFPLSVRKRPKEEIERRVRAILEKVELEGFAQRKPFQLSGGQQQRVALARTLIFEPALVLMDEPLGALDKRLREQMQLEIKRLHRDLGLTVVYVTHDQAEAMVLSDRVAVFHQGRIQQLDPPDVIHERPANAFVAQFVGETNSASGVVVAVGTQTVRLSLEGGLEVEGVSSEPLKVGDRRQISVRPERIRIGALPHLLENKLQATVEDTIYEGDRVTAIVRHTTGMRLMIDLGIDGLDNLPRRGEVVSCGWAARHCLVLDQQ